MKITIEPTGPREQCDNYPTIIVKVDTNESSISDMPAMFRTLLVGWGFDMESVKEILPYEDE